jgi:hypothetical protein
MNAYIAHIMADLEEDRHQTRKLSGIPGMPPEHPSGRRARKSTTHVA